MHRARDLLIRRRTQLVNMMRGLLAEFGIDIPEGLGRALVMAQQVVDGAAPEMPVAAAKVVGMLSRQALDTHARLLDLDRALLALQRTDDMARRLSTIPGIGPIGATALAASVTDPRQFRPGRQFAVWLGLTPLQNSSGGKERLGPSGGLRGAARGDGETGQAGNRDNPCYVQGIMACKAEWDPVRGLHQGQQSSADCINRPNGRLHPTNTSDLQIAPATREPSTEDENVITRHRPRRAVSGCSKYVTKAPARRWQPLRRG
jgi:hypothetical protein